MSLGLSVGLMATLSFLALATPAFAASKTSVPTNQELIDSAMKAAPASVSSGATVMTMGADGKMQTLRQGHNGWTCFPNDPTTPGTDPMCGDANAMEWAVALMEHQNPPTGKVGFMYMLQGGSDASNTDPWATGPAPGNHWIETGKHVMIVGAKGVLADYPRSVDPNTKEPYVMYPDTPYEHLMIPVN